MLMLFFNNESSYLFSYKTRQSPMLGMLGYSVTRIKMYTLELNIQKLVRKLEVTL